MNTELTQDQVLRIIEATGHIVEERTSKEAKDNAIQIVTTLTALCNGKLFEQQEEFTLCQACYDVAHIKKAGCGPLGPKLLDPQIAHKHKNLQHVAAGQPREILYWYSSTSKGLNIKATGHIVTAQVAYRTDGSLIERVTTLIALCKTNLTEQCGESKLMVKSGTSFVEQSFDRFLFEIHHGALVGIPLCKTCILRREQILHSKKPLSGSVDPHPSARRGG